MTSFSFEIVCSILFYVPGVGCIESCSGLSSLGTEDGPSQSKPEHISEIQDPFALDPCFESEAEMQTYLQAIGHKDIIITSDEVEIEVGRDQRARICDCYKCEDIKVNDEQDYLCCNPKFTSQKEDLCDMQEKDNPHITCVTQCNAYNASVNYYAVRGLLSSLRDNPQVKVKIYSTPTENMRYGSYRAASYLLEQRERGPLSACIVSAIRSQFPDPKVHYTGYVAKKK